jgi:hypothetical protein
LIDKGIPSLRKPAAIKNRPKAGMLFKQGFFEHPNGLTLQL